MSPAFARLAEALEHAFALPKGDMTTKRDLLDIAEREFRSYIIYVIQKETSYLRGQVEGGPRK